MYHCMVDLETLGTKPGCVVMSLGAVFFDPRSQLLGQRFYSLIDQKSCTDVGLTIDHDTALWWAKQDDAAFQIVKDTQPPTSIAPPLKDVLDNFSQYVRGNLEQGDRMQFWGNGAGFDEPILDAAWTAAFGKTKEKPWKYSDSRCYRTIRSEFPAVQDGEFQGVKHNALDDAVHQAKHALRILGATRTANELIRCAK